MGPPGAGCGRGELDANAAAGVLTAFTVGTAALFRWLFRSFYDGDPTYNRSIRTHTKEQVQARVIAQVGPARWRLSSLIGDELDQASGWHRSTDVIMGVLTRNPDAMIEFLVEVHGKDAVQELLDRTEESE